MQQPRTCGCAGVSLGPALTGLADEGSAIHAEGLHARPHLVAVDVLYQVAVAVWIQIVGCDLRNVVSAGARRPGSTRHVHTPTWQPWRAAGMAKGPMPAMTSRTRWPGRKLLVRRLCSCSSLEFQYTCRHTGFDQHEPGPCQHATSATCSRLQGAEAQGMGPRLAKVEAEGGAVLPALSLQAWLPRQHLHPEHPELVVDAAHLLACPVSEACPSLHGSCVWRVWGMPY